MDFFEQPDPAAGEHMYGAVYAQPEWIQAPPNVVPALVPLELVIGRSEDAVVVMSGIRAFPGSWDVTIITRRRPGTASHWEEHVAMMPPGMYPPGMPAADVEAMLRYGFRFADGTKVTSVGAGGLDSPLGEDGQPASPTMMHGSGGGGGGSWASEVHVWPLPPAGDVAVICEWTAAGIDATETVFDGALVREAAARAEQLWEPPDPHAGSAPGASVRIV